MHTYELYISVYANVATYTTRGPHSRFPGVFGKVGGDDMD
jgi:hypothetical protein